MTKNPFTDLLAEYRALEARIKEGGGAAGQKRQHDSGRMTARERITALCDAGGDFFELGLFAAHGMYEEWGAVPAAGVICGIGTVSQRKCMIIGNDATVKAGAAFPQTIKKILRCQRIAYECKLPLLYLVDSSGVFLPLQDEIFPDEDDFGRIFRNNCVLSAQGIPQIAAIMGNCIAGGAYLPVLCDTLIMTKGSGLYLAGPALVKAAIGQIVDNEALGGALMHSAVSGTVDFCEENDDAAIRRLRALVAHLPQDPSPPSFTLTPAAQNPHDIFSLLDPSGAKEYDMHSLLAHFYDVGSFEEVKADYGKTLICGTARIGGQSVGIIANQRKRCQTSQGGIEIGGVIYAESADKAARFILSCNQAQIPLLFVQDVMGFMVGKEAEQGGIIRSGAKLVNALSNSIVPKITLVVGSSFGAGNYALCGKAYDPNFILAWPGTRYAVMGAAQAADVVFSIQKKGSSLSDDELKKLHAKIKERYVEQTDIRYGAARGWVDAICYPEETRRNLIELFAICARRPTTGRSFHTGVIQT